MSRRDPVNYSQSSFGRSPWSLQERVAILMWRMFWPLLAGWTPRPFNRWRLSVLRLFGARIGSRVFVHGRARIQKPWNIELADGSCLGDRANLYSLDKITVGEDSIVAQEAYLCTGTHSREEPGWPLQTAPIRVGCRVFVGARAFVLPGVSLGDRSTIGAASVVTRDVLADATVVGNPAREVTREGGEAHPVGG